MLIIYIDIELLHTQLKKEEEQQDPPYWYDITNDLYYADPSVRYYIIKNLDRLMKVAGPEKKEIMLGHITSPAFVQHISDYSEILYEYVKQIINLSMLSDNKIGYLKALENICTDSLENFVIEDIEGGILTILSEMSEELPEQCERILREFNESKVVAKQSLIPAIISQFYSMLSQETQESYIEIFHNLAQQGVPLIKRKICQNLHEGGFLSDDEALIMLEQFIKDPNE